MNAAECNSIQAAKKLLLAGADVQMRDKDGLTAEDVAMKKNHIAIVQLLKEHQRRQRQPSNYRPPPQPSTSTSQSRPFAPPLSFPDAPTPPPPPNQQQQQRYHSQELEISFSELSIGDDLGRGSFGVVKLAELHKIHVAVKIFSSLGHDDPLATEVLQEMQREAKLLGNLRHPNVVSMMGICTTPPCIVMDYCSKGSLFEVIAGARSQSNNMHNQSMWRRRVGLVRDIALGMTFLHSRQEPVIHRDLKSPNILIDSYWKGKVADLNLSRAIKEVDESSRMAAMSTAVRPTNYRWLAPELLDSDTRASAASDVYALGIMMWEVLTWQIPFGRSSDPVIFRCLDKGERLDIPAMNELPGPEPASTFPGLNRYIQWMKQCWSQDPKKRPTMAEVASTLRELLNALPSTTDGNVAAGGAAGGAPSNEATECAICHDQKAVIALIHHKSNQGNIAHMCCCAECAEKLQSLGQNCPMCQRPIDGTVRVF